MYVFIPCLFVLMCDGLLSYKQLCVTLPVFYKFKVIENLSNWLHVDFNVCVVLTCQSLEVGVFMKTHSVNMRGQNILSGARETQQQPL